MSDIAIAAAPARAAAAGSATRQDIQILRGIAVLAVVFYHFGVPGFAGGYLGVDVFFVISGFLMMRILAAEQGAGRWWIPRFYLRRARRLLPAALVTIAVTSLLGLFVMARWDWSSYAGQAAGALSFTANIFVWQDGHDYFAPAAATRPLLHFWSLSLEEQFYLVLPLALLVIGTKLRLPLLALAAVVSLVGCWIIVGQYSWAAFYLLPTRAWELLLGAVLACVLIARPGLRIGWPIQAIGLLVIIVPILAPLDDLHPRLDALLVCLGTAAILAGADRGHRAGAPGRLLGRVGDISYSLYLVHWPILALATIAYIGEVPATVRGALLVAAFGLAALQYRFVETPFRRIRGGWRRQAVFLGGISVAAVTIAAGLVFQIYLRPEGAWPELRLWNYGLAGICDAREDTYVPHPECRTTDQPATALWGDSFMMQWGHSLRELPGGIVQITRSACPAIVGMTATPGRPDWLDRCFVYHQSAFDYIMGSPDIATVVLSVNFRLFTYDGDTRLLDPDIAASSSWDAARIAYGTMIRTLEAAGKRVVIVAAAATSGPDFGSCVERFATGLVTFGRNDCDFATADYFAHDGGVIALLRAIRDDTGVTVVWPAAVYCSDTTCETTIDGLPVYRDNAHMTNIAAPILAARMHLAEVVAGTARCTDDPADAAICAVQWPEWLAGRGAP